MAKTSPAKINTTSKSTSPNSTIAKAVKSGSSSEKAGIVGYNAGGGAIYGNPGGQNYSAANAPSKYKGDGKDTQMGFPSFASEQVDTMGNVNAAPTNKMESPEAKSALAPTQPIAPTPTPAAPPTPGNTTPGAPSPTTLTSTGTKAPTPSKADAYKSALSQIKGSGAPMPEQEPAAKGMIDAAVQTPPKPDPKQIQVDTDPYLANLTQTVLDYFSPQKQRESLSQTYQKLTKEAGIPELNTELMNMKNVIEGTEDDIRNEVTKAGGFATESQVMAMTASRNKQLIQNYNNLLETRNSQQDYVKTMMGFEQSDREYADNRASKMFDIQMQLADYGMKMKNNAALQYQKIVDTQGYEGLLAMTNGDPYYQGIVEKTLGLSAGGLQKLATMPPSESDRLDMDIKRAQLAKIKSEIGGRSGSSGSGGGVDEDSLQLARSIAAGYGSLKDLTPTNRGKVMSALYEAGIQTPEQKTAVKRSEDALGVANEILASINRGELVGGVGGQLSRLNPWSAAAPQKRRIDRLKALLNIDEMKNFKGLGSMSDMEFEAASKAASNLSLGMNINEQEAELKRIVKSLQITRSLNDPKYQKYLESIGE